MTTGMKQLMADVRAFHEKYGHPSSDKLEPLPSYEPMVFRQELHDEEDDELRDAMSDLMHGGGCGALEAVADALVDSIYVRIGTAVQLGIPLERIWAEVQRSNMTKTVNPDGGKPLKGPDYRPPEIHAAMWIDSEPRAIWGAGGDDDGE